MHVPSEQTRIAVPRANYVLAIRGPWLVAEFREAHLPVRPDYARLVVGDLDFPTPAVLRFRQALDQLDTAAAELLMEAGIPCPANGLPF